MSTESIALTGVREPPRAFGECLTSWMTAVDHKRLGSRYTVFALLVLVLGGIAATIIRSQLIAPLNTFGSPQTFNRMFTMHGTTMIFFAAMPILFGLAN